MSSPFVCIKSRDSVSSLYISVSILAAMPLMSVTTAYLSWVLPLEDMISAKRDISPVGILSIT